MPDIDKYMNAKDLTLDLQSIGSNLKNLIYKLPSSTIKQYLLSEISKPIEIRNMIGFYLLKSRITDMLNVATQENLNKHIDGNEIFNILKGIKDTLEIIYDRIKTRTTL